MPVPFLVGQAFLINALANLQTVYADMLGGKPLPMFTLAAFALAPWYWLFPLLAVLAAIALSIKLPSADLALCLVVTTYTVAFTLGGLFVLSMFAPLISIISGMQQQ